MNTVYLSKERLQEISEKIKDISVCMVGDFCLDVYWRADMTRSLLSRETPHFPLPVIDEQYAPGGGGNVVNNLYALGVKEVIPVSVFARDWRGMLLADWLDERSIDRSKVFWREKGVTTAYCKPLRMGISDVVYEDPRLDFLNYESISPELESLVIDALDKAAEKVDIIAVSDQCQCGVITTQIRKHLSTLANKIPVVVDSREHAMEYTGVIVKPNEVEAAFADGRDITGLDLSLEEYAKIGLSLHKKNGRPVVVTLGEKGALWCSGDSYVFAPTVKARPPVDIVGAGDSFLSAFCSAFAACGDGPSALAFANLASGVTVRKVGMTGTATLEEILEKWEENYS